MIDPMIPNAMRITVFVEMSRSE